MDQLIKNALDTVTTKQLKDVVDSQGKFNLKIYDVLSAIELELDQLRKQIEQLKPKDNNGIIDTENEAKN